MAAKFKIINLALRRLGQDPITALGEETENYRKVNDIYDLLLKSLLRSHPWSFNKEEISLTALSETPILEDYTYVFQLPADFVRLNKTSVEPVYSHKIKGRKLYSNSNAIKIEYGRFIADPDAWVTSHAYIVGDYVLQNSAIYYCLTAHTSETFATDLAADKWVEQDIYDPSFTDMFATALAYDLCIPITKDADLKKVLGEELKTKLNLAKSLNGQEVTPDEATQDEWLNSRT
ncbi:MAG: hypothetical protein WC312_03840 [Candidatus Omnitrophota bacterium]|jgi:hypothetical protein